MVTETSPMMFEARDQDALVKEVRDRYGDAVANILERVDVKAASTEDQAKVLKKLYEANPTADAEALLDSYRARLSQIKIKSVVREKWYDKLGRGVKATVLAPFRAVGYAFKKAPVLTTLSLAGLTAFLAYYYGIPWAQFSGAGGDVRTAGVGGTTRRLGFFAPGGDSPGIGEQPAATGGSYGSVKPVPVPMPGM